MDVVEYEYRAMYVSYSMEVVGYRGPLSDDVGYDCGGR